jgi:hypothetical protein
LRRCPPGQDWSTRTRPRGIFPDPLQLGNDPVQAIRGGLNRLSHLMQRAAQVITELAF